MALRVVEAEGQGLVGLAVVELLRAGLASCGQATLLAPSFAQALMAQRELAAAGGMGLGVSCETPSSWVAERWEVWGDGTHLVDGVARLALATQVLQGARGLALTPGVVQTFCELVRVGLPWLVGEGAERAAACEGLTEAERQMVLLVVPYAQLLDEHGLAEESQAMCAIAGRLRDAGVAMGPVVVAGFDTLAPAVRALVGGLAELTEVTVFEASDAVDKGTGLLSSLFEREGVVHSPRELGLTTGAGDAIGGPSPCHPVWMVLPAGPLAEGPAVADEVRQLLADGARELVVCGPDARRLWHELVPRLASSGTVVDVQYSVPFASTGGGRAFLQFARGVAQMAALAEGWPVPIPRERNLEARVGDMSWWPPRDLSDFLMSGISGVPAEQARRIDVRWRGNRLLSPRTVLDTLQAEKEVSPQVVAATRELLRGRLGSAASRLLAPLAEAQEPEDVSRQTARREDAEALATVLTVARTLGELGLSADPDEGTVSLTKLVNVAAMALEQSSVMVRLRMDAWRGAECNAAGEGASGADDAWSSDGGRSEQPDVLPSAPHVRIMGTGAASQLAPGSADALIICGLTSTESSIPRDPGVAAELLAALGIEELPDPMAAARAQFARLIAVPRRTLCLERVLYTADGRDAYASVMLIELLASLGIEAGGKPSAFRAAVRAGLPEGAVVERSETAVGRNISSSGAEPQVVGEEHPLPAGEIDASIRHFVSPPPEGMAMEDGRPLLSASQIETYLECPYKWFSQRRLRLADADAGFGGAEMGTFVHRVLEVTHGQMFEEAVAAHADGLLAEAASRGFEPPLREVVDVPGGPGTPPITHLELDIPALAQLMGDIRLPGSRVDLHREGSLEHAQELLDAEFDLHLSHMYYLERGRRPLPQALVPHDTQERARVDELREDLHTLLAYEGRLLYGFEPRFFEWSFGKHDAVDYAGARLVGTIDRVDVDAHGQAVVVDYKHKRPGGFAGEYDVFADGVPTPGDAFVLPRRVQALIYAQVVRRRYPQLRLRGAVYLCTKGDHVLAGAVDRNLLDNVFGDVGLSAKRMDAVAVDPGASFGNAPTPEGATLPDAATGLDALLDATEEAIAAKISEMLAGNIEANPLDKEACQWCPVLGCERRIAS